MKSNNIWTSTHYSVHVPIGKCIRKHFWDFILDSCEDRVWENVQISIEDSVWISFEHSIQSSVRLKIKQYEFKK